MILYLPKKKNAGVTYQRLVNQMFEYQLGDNESLYRQYVGKFQEGKRS